MGFTPDRASVDSTLPQKTGSKRSSFSSTTSTSPTESPQSGHVHVETPYPVVEHSHTWDSNVSNSFFHIHKLNQHFILPERVKSLPNPMSVAQNSVDHHVAEFRYGHSVRVAKREAKRLFDHQSHSKSRRDSLDMRAPPVDTIPEYEEIVENWSEKDAQAWAAELEKRQAATKLCREGANSWNST